jgi:hypothetical protein
MLPTNPKPFLCDKCIELVDDPMSMSKNPKLCVNCYEDNESTEKGICEDCGGANPDDKNWGLCDRCFNKRLDDDDVDIPEEDMLEE